MPILSHIQKRSPAGRVLIGGMYALLIFGSTWMVYPFLLMLSGSVKTEVDIRQFDVFPRFFYDDATLFRKFEEQRYGGLLDAFTAATRYDDEQARPLFSFEHLQAPPMPPPAQLADWNEFLRDARKNWPPYFLQLGHNFGYKIYPEVTLEYQHRLWRTFPDIPRTELTVPPQKLLTTEKWHTRVYQSVQGAFKPVYDKMREELPDRYFVPTTVEGWFVATIVQPRYGSGTNGVAKLNAKWGSDYSSVFDATMGRAPPMQAAQREDWWRFVQSTLSARFIRFDASHRPAYQASLKAKYKEVAALNKVYGASYSAWNEIDFPEPDAPFVAFNDAEAYVQTLSSPEGLTLDSPDFRWRDFLRQKYRDDLAALNRVHGTNYASFDEAAMPVLAHDWQIMKENKGAIIREYVARNYRVVWDYLSNHGRAFQNTIIFVVLNILAALIVNPLAAYALSRFQPRWGYVALFVLMATMAFPHEVTQIPGFLLLRELGWLNTFLALIIPGAAHGYSIFLLKGFFDSLPKDLYESATLDGASEMRIFLSITMPLSAPILAVIALGAFTSAYGAFMFALLVCQKQSMWTLMVYIYQLQQQYGTPVIFAALVLAALPTLVVFVLCQNIIMRGIVVPVEK